MKKDNHKYSIELNTNNSIDSILKNQYNELYNLHDKIVKDIFDKITKEFDKKLSDYIKDNLKNLGYTFESDFEFFNFCEKRIHRISFENKPNEYEFYLDFVDIENKGVFLGAYCDKYDLKMDGNTVTVTIGKSI